MYLIEFAECKYFQEEIIEHNGKLKQEWHFNAKNAGKFQDYGGSAGHFDNKSPNPFMDPQPERLVRRPEGVMPVPLDCQPAPVPVIVNLSLSKASLLRVKPCLQIR
jgi:hypothetical protein